MRALEYEQAVQLKAVLAKHKQWSPSVPRDPLNTANGPYPTWPKLRDERASLRQIAIDNVEDVNEVDYPLEPIHFGFWASRNGYDSRLRWPSELQLREEYANERLHEREVVVSRLLKQVESAAQRERQQVHRAFPKGAADAEIEEAEERRNRCEAPSEQWSQSWDLFEKESRDTDIGYKNTLVSWLRATKRDESAPLEERKIEEAFQAWLWTHFAGGMGRHLERQRAISAGNGDACPAREQERDRAMERAMREAAKGATYAREAPDDFLNSNDGLDDRDDQDDDDEISRHLRAPDGTSRRSRVRRGRASCADPGAGHCQSVFDHRVDQPVRLHVHYRGVHQPATVQPPDPRPQRPTSHAVGWEDLWRRDGHGQPAPPSPLQQRPRGRCRSLTKHELLLTMKPRHRARVCVCVCVSRLVANVLAVVEFALSLVVVQFLFEPG